MMKEIHGGGERRRFPPGTRRKSMVYRTLGNTGLKVSEIGLGCEGIRE